MLITLFIGSALAFCSSCGNDYLIGTIGFPTKALSNFVKPPSWQHHPSIFAEDQAQAAEDAKSRNLQQEIFVLSVSEAKTNVPFVLYFPVDKQNALPCVYSTSYGTYQYGSFSGYETGTQKIVTGLAPYGFVNSYLLQRGCGEAYDLCVAPAGNPGENCIPSSESRLVARLIADGYTDKDIRGLPPGCEPACSSTERCVANDVCKPDVSKLIELRNVAPGGQGADRWVAGTKRAVTGSVSCMGSSCSSAVKSLHVYVTRGVSLTSSLESFKQRYCIEDVGEDFIESGKGMPVVVAKVGSITMNSKTQRFAFDHVLDNRHPCPTSEYYIVVTNQDLSEGDLVHSFAAARSFRVHTAGCVSGDDRNGLCSTGRCGRGEVAVSPIAALKSDFCPVCCVGEFATEKFVPSEGWFWGLFADDDPIMTFESPLEGNTMVGGSKVTIRWRHGKDPLDQDGSLGCDASKFGLFLSLTGIHDDDDDADDRNFPNERIPLVPVDGPLDLNKGSATVILPSFLRSTTGAVIVGLFAEDRKQVGFWGNADCEFTSPTISLKSPPCHASDDARVDTVGQCVDQDMCLSLAGSDFVAASSSTKACNGKPTSGQVCCAQKRSGASAGFREGEGVPALESSSATLFLSAWLFAMVPSMV